jgi:hypothetical protein
VVHKERARIWSTIAGITASFLILSACAIKLAPAYDKTVVEGLGALNEQMMTLFASVSGGTQAASFDRRQEAYNTIIGKLDAIKIQSDARPVPPSNFSQIFGGGGRPASPDDVTQLRAPTGDILTTMINTMTKMRDTDRKQGLTPFEVSAFKNNIVISMDQALTYEKALER